MPKGYSIVHVDGETVYRNQDGSDIITEAELDKLKVEQPGALPGVLAPDPED